MLSLEYISVGTVPVFQLIRLACAYQRTRHATGSRVGRDCEGQFPRNFRHCIRIRNRLKAPCSSPAMPRAYRSSPDTCVCVWVLRCMSKQQSTFFAVPGAPFGTTCFANNGVSPGQWLLVWIRKLKKREELSFFGHKDDRFAQRSR